MTRGLILGLISHVALMLALYQTAIAKEYAYLFSGSRFVKLEVETGKFVDLGDLRWAGMRYAGSPFAVDPAGKRILVSTVVNTVRAKEVFREWSPVTPESWISGLVVLEPDQKGDFWPVRLLDLGVPPRKESRLGPGGHDITGVQFSPDGRTLYISWRAEKDETTGIFDGITYRVLRHIRGGWVSEKMCFASDGKTVYAPWGSRSIERRILPNYDLMDTLLIDRVGRTRFISKQLVAASSCWALILEVVRVGGDEHTIYVYDIESDQIVLQKDLNLRGEYKLLSDRSQWLLDEEKLAPDVLPDGRVIGQRVKKVGRLHVYELPRGREITTIQLPEDGRGMWVNRTNKKLYYMTPGLLSVIDLQTYRIEKRLEIPEDFGGVMVFLDE